MSFTDMDLFKRGGRGIMLLAAAVLGTTTVFGAVIVRSRIPRAHPRRIIPSPRTSLLPRLSKSQIDSLGYPPDALPGARDVRTPYGFMRVYEWGPDDGRKVLMVHGDATPAPLFSRIADVLVERGCRVIAFDLWGRGYTDTPSGIQHDVNLYGLQLIYAITSSPLKWSTFSIIGFSLGGSISLSFLGNHPSMVESLVLLGPAGLIRQLPPEYVSFYYRHPSLISKSRLKSLAGAALGVDLHPKSIEVKEQPEGFTPAAAVQFQFDHHAGHVESFVSTVQYGPIQHQEPIWERAADILRPNPAAAEDIKSSPLYGGKILVICGHDDTVIPPQDVESDLKNFLGDSGNHFDFRMVPGTHGFPWPEGQNIGNMIAEFWGINP